MADTGEHRVVVSANRLDSGAVVWLDRDHRWLSWLDQTAAVFDDATAAEPALAAAKLTERSGIVVGSALVEVSLEQGRPLPIRPRERIRALGPSVRPVTSWTSA